MLNIHSGVLHTDIWKFIWLSDEDDKIEPYLNDYRRRERERESDAVNYMLAVLSLTLGFEAI